jgi:DNA-binding transcriptional ArsR family regulator
MRRSAKRAPVAADRSTAGGARDARRELAELEAVFAALAHASRRHVLLVLHFHGGSMTAGEIAARFDCSWPTTSRHLRQLEDAGLVTVETRGRERVYSVNGARLRDVVGGWLSRFDDTSLP